MEITAEKLQRMRMLHVQFLLIDVRPHMDYLKAHIEGAISFEASEFVAKISDSVPAFETPMVIYDQQGVRTKDLVNEAEKIGYLNVVDLEGGYDAYLRETIPSNPAAAP